MLSGSACLKHGRGHLKKLQRRTDFGKYVFCLLFELQELREKEQTNASDCNSVCIFTWCYKQTCYCLPGWCTSMWGRGLSLWFGLQVAIQLLVFQFCLPAPPRPANLWYVFLSCKKKFHVGHSLCVQYRVVIQRPNETVGSWACRAVCEPKRASHWLCPCLGDLFVLKSCLSPCPVVVPGMTRHSWEIEVAE